MSLPRGRGRIVIERGIAYVAARCPLCHQEHRYAKGAPDGEELAEIRRLGFTDEWLPCQRDLPGNFWRVLISPSRGKGKPPAARPPKRPGRP
jgi:hypothetical protein